MKKTIFALTLVFIAIIPFAKFFFSYNDGLNLLGTEKSVISTGNIILGASDQYADFLINKEGVIEFLMNNYDKGFFHVDDENEIYSTMIALESLNKLEYIEELTGTMKRDILVATERYYTLNKGEDWFSPKLLYSYYRINDLLNAKTLMNTLSDRVMMFKVVNSGFSSAVGDKALAEVSETFYALKLLDSQNQSILTFKHDIISFLKSEPEFSEEEYLMIDEIGNIIGVDISVPRSAVVSCLIKTYIPFVDSTECSVLLREKNILVYIPSVLMVLLGYIMLVAR